MGRSLMSRSTDGGRGRLRKECHEHLCTECAAWPVAACVLAPGLVVALRGRGLQRRRRLRRPAPRGCAAPGKPVTLNFVEAEIDAVAA